ncbi:hypothetical protein ACS0TY_007775 [Phlomoides rotata]
MDGYNQHTWNPCYDDYTVYSPQHQDFGYDNGMSFENNYQTPYAYSHYQERGNDERRPSLADTLASFMAQSKQLHENCYEEPSFEQDEEPSIKEEEDPREEQDEENELNDEERELMKLLDEFIEEFEEINCVEPKDQETNENSPLSFFSRIYDNRLFNEKTNRILPFIVLDDDRSPLEANEEDPNKERKEDDEIIDEKEEEESPLIDLSNIDQQNQEEANDELKSVKSCWWFNHTWECLLKGMEFGNPELFITDVSGKYP